jgi:hypothetical protein
MPAHDALHFRTVLTEQFGLPKFCQLVDSYAISESVMGSARRLPDAFKAPAMKRALDIAETYYVAPGMSALAQMAAEDFPEDEVILPEDLPSPAGIMWLPARFRFLEMRGRLQVVHGVLWMNNRIWYLADRADPEDEMSAELRIRFHHGGTETFGRYDVCALEHFEFGKPMPRMITFPKGVLPIEAKVTFGHTPDGSLTMATDHPVDLSMLQSTIDTRGIPSVTLRYILAIWRLMQQSLASVHRETEMPRADRRRAARNHVPTAVTVIMLRRREQTREGTGEKINYRTIVRGHWRRVWCGSGAEKYQRAVYIHPFWRGPENAPIIIRNRINALTR